MSSYVTDVLIIQNSIWGEKLSDIVLSLFPFDPLLKVMAGTSLYYTENAFSLIGFFAAPKGTGHKQVTVDMVTFRTLLGIN